MKKVLYYFLRLYVWCALRVYFKKIITHGFSNIPRQGPVLFLANHQNALLDALVFAITVPRYCHFIARADVFRNRMIAHLLTKLNMRPVYRLRDGIKSIPNNKQTFTWASSVLLRNECLLFFPEGNHSLWRRVRPLSKGFTRVVDEALMSNPLLDLHLVPVGINYTDHTGFRGSVSICYGEAISVHVFKDNLQALRTAMEEKLKTLITHVEDEATYPDVISKLEQTSPDYLDPVETNRRIKLIEHGESPGMPLKKKAATSPAWLLKFPLYLLSGALNAVPLIIWHLVKKKITDPVFTGTFRFAVGITLVPVYYVFLMIIIAQWFNGLMALLTGVLCLFSLPAYQWCRKANG